jgi:allantoinase
MHVLPGAIDPHVHFDDPGYTDREDFVHGTSAAASGGVTTIIDMPCTSVPPVTSMANLREKLSVVSPRAVVDYAFHGGVAANCFDPDPEPRMRELAASVIGFKCYLVSGMDTFPAVSLDQLDRVLRIGRVVARPILLHAEVPEHVSSGAGEGPAAYYRSRPEAAEIEAIRAATTLADKNHARLHIVHVSTGEGARLVAASPMTSGETAPHYLAYTFADFERIGSPLKVTPPVKPAPNREMLWEALRTGHLAFVASDHAPAPPEQKHTGSIWTDYAGIPGTGTLLPFLYSEGYRTGRLSLSQLTRATAEAAATSYGLAGKGGLAVGADGDCVVIDPDSTWTIDGSRLLSKGTVTPFDGTTLTGRIEKTILRGRLVYDRHDGIVVEPGYGTFLAGERS